MIGVAVFTIKKSNGVYSRSLKILAVILLIFASSAFFQPGQAKAGHSNGYLIDDSKFTATSSMSTAQIQQHLANNGSLLANWKDDVDMYQVSSRFKTAGNRCLVHKATNLTAAQIIAQAANDWQSTYVIWRDAAGNQVSKNPNIYNGEVHSCSQVASYADINLKTVSPKVILATLQKEQSAVTATGTYSKTESAYYDPACCASNEYKLAWAMGYGVPDSPGKLHGYKGFYNQVNYGAWQLRFNYEKSAGSTNWDGTGSWSYFGYKVGNTYNIDGSNVKMGNRSTAALYYYTPHLSGNSNFVSLYENWFGTTVGLNLPTCGDLNCVYRLYRGAYKKHFWTSNIREVNNLDAYHKYRYEGVAWYVHSSISEDTTPVYRLYNGRLNKHFWTSSVRERDNLRSTQGFRYEGIAFYVSKLSSPTTAPVYRLYNGRLQKHFWTTSVRERDNIVNTQGFRYEGVAFYVPTE